jgi:hypothetical protein
MIYKIFPAATSSCFFSTAICSSQRQNKAENKTEVAKQKKPLKVMLRSSTTI